MEEPELAEPCGAASPTVSKSRDVRAEAAKFSSLGRASSQCSISATIDEAS